jgi:ABC-type glycerol-3-phosphate transport system substrate-binding protein
MKKSVFRMLALMLSAMLVLGACTRGGSDSGAGSGGDAGKTETVTLKVIMEEVPDTDIVLGMLHEFHQAHSGIRLDIEALPYDQMRDKIVASFLAPRATYDLIVVDNPWMYDFASAGYLEPLDDRIQQAGGAYHYEDFAKPLRDIAEVDGKVYAIPFYNYALGLIYRTDLFEEKGLQVPATLDELMEAARQLKSDNMAGIAMTPQRGYKVFEEWGNWLFAAGGAIQDEAGNVVLDSPQARDALAKYIQTYNESAPANSLNWAFDEALRATAGGQAAMMLSYNWMLPTLNNPDGPAGELAGKFGLAEVPGGKAVLGAWFWAIPANSNNKDAAWTFVHWLTSPEQDTKRVIAGGAPVRDSVMDDPQVHEQGFGQEYYATVKGILKDASPLGDGPGAEEMIQAVGLELSAAVSGQKSVDQAVADAAKQAGEIMSK